MANSKIIIVSHGIKAADTSKRIDRYWASSDGIAFTQIGADVEYTKTAEIDAKIRRFGARNQVQLRCCRQGVDCIQPQPAPRRGLQPANSIMVNPEGIRHRCRCSARAEVHDYDLPARFSIGWHERHSVDGKQTHLYHHRRIYLDGLWIDIRDL